MVARIEANELGANVHDKDRELARLERQFSNLGSDPQLFARRDELETIHEQLQKARRAARDPATGVGETTLVASAIVALRAETRREAVIEEIDRWFETARRRARSRRAIKADRVARC